MLNIPIIFTNYDIISDFLNLPFCSEHFISIKHRILATFNISKQFNSDSLYAFNFEQVHKKGKHFQFYKNLVCFLSITILKIWVNHIQFETFIPILKIKFEKKKFLGGSRTVLFCLFFLSFHIYYNK